MRLIDADALKERFNKRIKWLALDVHDEYSSGLFHGAETDVELIDEMSTIDPASLRPKGEWITASFWKRRKGHRVQLVFKKCSLCNIRVKARWNNNFCPNCGADMREEEANDGN